MNSNANLRKIRKTVGPTGDSIKLNLMRVVVYVFLVLIAVFCLFPFVILIINSTRLHSELLSKFYLVPGSHFFQNLKNVLTDTNIPLLNGLGNSVFIAALTAILTTYFSAMTAFGIFMYDFKLRNFAFSFIMFILMVPTQVSALGFLRLVDKMHMMNTYWPLILPSIAAPSVFFYMKQYMDSVVPKEMVEAARVDGSNEFMTFNRIVLPVIKPALAVQGIFSFVSSWNNYFIPVLVINSKNKKTIPILIAELRSADYMKFDLAKIYIMIFVAIIPLIVVYLFLSRFILENLTLGSVKG
ncbi:MAG: carbohydrate ABC transporter permease [Sphaerochaetaceae bacterium]|nr:carbohydrate ABC transporter permease [Sphaerochaetaceae bacterium]